MSTSTKIDRESSTRQRLEGMEQPVDARQQQRHRRRLGRSHREPTPVTGEVLQDDASPETSPPDPSPQMVRMQIRPPFGCGGFGRNLAIGNNFAGSMYNV